MAPSLRKEFIVIIYNPEFFNAVSPKFLKQVDTVLRACVNDGVTIKYIHMFDYGAGNIPTQFILSRDHYTRPTIGRKLLAWQSLCSDLKCNSVVVGKYCREAQNVFVNIGGL